MNPEFLHLKNTFYYKYFVLFQPEKCLIIFLSRKLCRITKCGGGTFPVGTGKIVLKKLW